MITTLDVEEAAEAYVATALRELHFSIVQPGARSTGAKVIEAWKAGQRIVVHVNTAVSPAAPLLLTLEEEQDLRRRAKRTGGQAWEAQVLLSADLGLVQLEWRPLE